MLRSVIAPAISLYKPFPTSIVDDTVLMAFVKCDFVPKNVFDSEFAVFNALSPFSHHESLSPIRGDTVAFLTLGLEKS